MTDLRALLSTLDRIARDDLRRVLIRDQADRDAISSRLMRYREPEPCGSPLQAPQSTMEAQ